MPDEPDSPYEDFGVGLPGDELLDDGLLSDARGGRKPGAALSWEVVRELTPDDLPLLAANPPPALQAPRQTLSQVRHSHHQLAQELAKGTEQAEAALITGYSPTYISILKTDPTFQELLAYYAVQQEQKFVDVLERMRTLGLSTLDELQNRLEIEPEGWTKRELMELAELTLVKPQIASRSAVLHTNPGSSGGISVSVNFVKADPEKIVGLDRDGKPFAVIDHEPP